MRRRFALAIATSEDVPINVRPRGFVQLDTDLLVLLAHFLSQAGMLPSVREASDGERYETMEDIG
jgi:hypothetical protein